MQCVSQLVRDSREFATLLGRMEPGTGVRRPGAIDKVSSYPAFQKHRILHIELSFSEIRQR